MCRHFEKDIIKEQRSFNRKVLFALFKYSAWGLVVVFGVFVAYLLMLGTITFSNAYAI